MSDEPRVSEYAADRPLDCCACGRKIGVGETALTIVHRSVVETTHATCPDGGGSDSARRLMRDLMKELR